VEYQSFVLKETPADLNSLHRLLELDPTSGTVRFAGERTIVLGTAALGELRRHVVLTFGAKAARTMLVRLGFAHGWRMAGAVRSQWAEGGVDQWREVGGYVHMLQGHMRIDVDGASPLLTGGCQLSNSYEAEQHLLHFGASDETVCWNLCGTASGYLSRTESKRIFVVEDRCVARGDAACRFRGKTELEWGRDFAKHRPFFQIDDLTLEESELSKGPPRGHGAISADRVPRSACDEIVARSFAMSELLKRAERAAATELSVLVGGESGVGKERVARFIHERSLRASGPFVAVNCAAIPDALCESEMFGHARGAFTGAIGDRIGLFEAASGGTLFLDEIGEMSLLAQAKVLRVLQERTLRRVGDSRERTVDVRVISASKRPLQNEVGTSRFREDLYYRLNAIELFLPPLRERPDDIIPIAESALSDACARLCRPKLELARDAVEALTRYEWPGNVRELCNAIERAVVFASGPHLLGSDLDLPRAAAFILPARPSDTRGVKTLDAVEREYILAVLARNGGNQVNTANQLGIAESTLYRKLKFYGGIVTARGSVAQARGRNREP
jgi:two-component system, NtrC family, response regulator HydG